jgi:cytochrome P450
MLHIGSANRDERNFDDADTFDIQREMTRHLGMGQGIHFCVGAPLGREMAYSLFREVLNASDHWEIDLANSERVLTPNFRGFSKLHLSLT